MFSLRRDVTGFVGRDDELRRLDTLLDAGAVHVVASTGTLMLCVTLLVPTATESLTVW